MSLIDDHPQELLYVSAQGIKLSLSLRKTTQTLSLEVGHYQIDNQSQPSPHFPVLMVPAALNGLSHLDVFRAR